MRAHYRGVIGGLPAGVVYFTALASATIWLYQEGTTTPIAQPIYAGPTGLTTLTNPLTASVLSEVQFWLDEDERLDLYITYPGISPQTLTVDVIGANVDILDPRDFDTGKLFNDLDDNTVGIQAALDSIGSTATAQRTGRQVCIKIPGPAKITGTLVCRRKSVIIQGTGWGRRDGSPNAGYVRWAGSAGIPMLKMQDCLNAHVRNIRFVGSVANPPSAAVNWNETNDAWPITANGMQDVFMGVLDNGEADNGPQFADAILLDGFAINNAELLLQNVRVNHVTRDCIHVGCIQSVNLTLNGVYLNHGARSAIYNAGYILGNTVVVADNACDIMMPLLDDNGASSAAKTQINQYFSENAGRLSEMLGSNSLIINGTSISLTPSLNADGKVIKCEGSTSCVIELRNLRFFQSGSPPTAPFLSLSPGGAGSRHVVIDGCTGWVSLTGGTNGMTLATASNTARIYLHFRDCPQTGSFLPTREARNFLTGRSGLAWDMNRWDVLNDTNQKLWDDFTGRALDANKWGGRVGSNGSCVTPTVVSDARGVCRLVTGADAGGTMALNGSQLDAQLVWNGAVGWFTFEARLKISAITNVAVFVGLTDQISALEMPFTLAAADALTSNATDAVGFLFDTGADADNWWAVGVKTDVDATHQNLGVAPAAGTNDVLRLEFNGNAVVFYRNGVVIGSTMTLGLGNINLTPVVAAFSRAAATRNVDVDYIQVQSLR